MSVSATDEVQAYEPDLEDVLHEEMRLRYHRDENGRGPFSRGERRTEAETDVAIAEELRFCRERAVRLELLQQIRAERSRDRNWWRELIDIKWNHR